jgi:hypothetical protein
VTVDECASRTGFEISFKCDRGLFVRKSDIGQESPRPKLRCMWRTTFIMFFKPLSQIASRTDKCLSWARAGLQQVDVIHHKAGLPAVAWSFGRPACAKATACSLQPSTCAPLQAKAGAGDEARTRDVHLGKVVLYQLSYTRSFERDNNVQSTAPRNLLIASEGPKSLNPNRGFTASYDQTLYE